MRKLFLLGTVFLLSIGMSLAQKTITGSVKDPAGNPIIGASILVKQTAIGTTSAEDGTFTINLPADKNTLEATAVGYQSQEIIVSGNEAHFTLSADEGALEEVVIAGYGQAIKKTEFTGSANILTDKDIKTRAVINPLNALAGTGPGIQTTAGTGAPGSAPRIVIRGFSSAGATSNDPLYVVDGVPYTGGIENINAADIESISTLKDAATTALWGSRAANGVVMITTKKGSKNRSMLNFKVVQGVSSRAIPEYDRVNAFEYYPLMWESMKFSRMYNQAGVRNATSEEDAGKFASDNIYKEVRYNPFSGVGNTEIVLPNGQLNPNATQLLWGDDLDWTKELLRRGYRQDYTIDYGGGSEKADYFGSFGYTDEKGYIIRSDWKRFTGRLNLNVNPVKWFKTGLNLSGAVNAANRDDASGSSSYVNPFMFTRSIGPIYPVYAHNPTTGDYLLDANGQRFYDYGNMASLGAPNNRPGSANAGRHILEETKLNQNSIKSNILSARTYGSLIFTPWLSFTTTLATDLTNFNGSSYQNTEVGDGAPAGRLSKENYRTQSYTFTQQLDFSTRFGDHNLKALVAHENYDYKYNTLSGGRQNQVAKDIYEFPNFTVINSLYSREDNYRIESYLSSLNYDYLGKYFLHANFRRDGNSRFSKDTRWSNFWGLSGAWSIAKENFLKNATWITDLKLRSSYGQLGSDALIDADAASIYYAYQALYALGENNADEPGAIQIQLANPLLTWETNNNFDLGVDFALFNNRLGGTIEFYNRNTSGLIFNVPLPISSGDFDIPTNIGNMNNRGIELELFGDIVRGKNFTWNLKVNATTLKNKITKMPEEFRTNGLISGTKKLMEGRSLYDYWLRDWYGVDPTDGSPLFYAVTTDGLWNDGTGNLKNTYRVLGGDTLTTDYNSAKFGYMGSAIPKLMGGVQNTFSYKGLSLNVLLQYQIGGKIYDATYASLMNTGAYGGALHKDALQRWTKEGAITNVPRLQNNSSYSGQSDRYLTDASFLNIRSATLSYSLPQSLVSKIEARNINVFVSGENLYLFSKRKGMDVNQSFAGVTSNRYTPSRIVSAGLSVNF